MARCGFKPRRYHLSGTARPSLLAYSRCPMFRLWRRWPMGGGNEVNDGFTEEELRTGIKLKPGQAHVLRLINLRLHVRLLINPQDARTRDDRFTLRGGARG